MDVHIITPQTADMVVDIDRGLVNLTEAICAATDQEPGYGLGGTFGYGADFENDVFVMRRYYWGDCDCGQEDREIEWLDSHRHANDCYQSDLRREKIKLGWKEKDYGWLSPPKEFDYAKAREIEDGIYSRLCKKHGKDRKWGAAIHCTCDYHPNWLAWSSENEHSENCTPCLPNFKHKDTGLEVRWYKWIGRDMEVTSDENVCLSSVLRDCLNSLPPTA